MPFTRRRPPRKNCRPSSHRIRAAAVCQVRTAGKSLCLLVRIAPACADMGCTNNLVFISPHYPKTQPTHIAAHLSASLATASAKLVSTVFRDTGAMRCCQLRARCAAPVYHSSTSHFGSESVVPTNARTQLSARSRAQAACVTSRPPTIHRSFLFLPAQKETVNPSAYRLHLTPHTEPF